MSALTTTNSNFLSIFGTLSTPEEARDRSLEQRRQATPLSANDQNSMTLVYGELGLEATIDLFQRLNTVRTTRKTNSTTSTFLDVGSGSGKVLIAAALLAVPAFRRNVGIELLESLHDAALANVGIYEKAMKNVSSPLATTATSEERTDKESTDTIGTIECIHGDALSSNTLTENQWKDIDVVFCNSTMFNEQMMQKLSTLPFTPGTVCCTSTHALNDTFWELMDEWKETRGGNWGHATTLFIFVKRTKKESMIRRMAKKMSSVR